MTIEKPEADTDQPEKGSARDATLREDIRRIQERLSRLRVLDDRSADEIIGYDANGLPT